MVHFSPQFGKVLHLVIDGNAGFLVLVSWVMVRWYP